MVCLPCNTRRRCQGLAVMLGSTSSHWHLVTEPPALRLRLRLVWKRELS